MYVCFSFALDLKQTKKKKNLSFATFSTHRRQCGPDISGGVRLDPQSAVQTPWQPQPPAPQCCCCVFSFFFLCLTCREMFLQGGHELLSFDAGHTATEPQQAIRLLHANTKRKQK